MRPGDRVVVTAKWSSFRHMHGTVTKATPHLMVQIDGERLPIRIEEPSVRRVDGDEVSLTGAE